MDHPFSNVYDDERRADSYSKLEFPGSYYLAFRDLPELFARHVTGRRALDFGCGAGRSTRFLGRHGFDPVGVDISAPMLEKAREVDPGGDYRLVPDGDLGVLVSASFDLALSAFTFDNVPTIERKVALFRHLARLLDRDGKIVNVVSAPEIYVNEWTSFSTAAYPENREAASGEIVRIVMLDVEDRRPVEDVFWTDADYDEVYGKAGLRIVEKLRPLGRAEEPIEWISETRISPWVVYVLAPSRA